MWENSGILFGINILLAFFTVYIFFFYFDVFFQRRKSMMAITGFVVFMGWELNIAEIIYRLPAALNICATIGVTLFAATNIFEGEFWEKCFFAISFDAMWMLMETLSGYVLRIYFGELADLQPLGAFLSKLLFFIVLISLKRVFTNERIRELPAKYSILLIFISIGSIYIMNNIFMLGYKVNGNYGEGNIQSAVTVIILLCMNILVFYIYMKLADDLQLRRINSVYAQQLELCERHQSEMEISTLRMKDIRHNMRNNYVAILAYAERGECDKIIRFVNDVAEDGKLNISSVTNSGNIVIDSLLGYWHMAAQNEGIEFRVDLCIPMQMPFKGADISLILGNLLENAVEAARKVEEEKYIRVSVKYDKSNLLIFVENNYKDPLIKTKDGKLKSTKEDTENHGIGLRSVCRVVDKYQGAVTVDDSVPNRFLVRVVMYGAEIIT